MPKRKEGKKIPIVVYLIRKSAGCPVSTNSLANIHEPALIKYISLTPKAIDGG